MRKSSPPLVHRRQTRQRRLVYETVASTKAHPTAQWIYERVRQQMPRLSLGTVYRNLQLLVAQGRLRAWTRGRTIRFDADLAAHDHFFCRSCGLLRDLPRERESLATEKRLKARGYEIQERLLEFVGLCRDCRRSQKAHGSEGETRWHR